MIRGRTDAQVTLAELLFLRWGIRRCRPSTLVETAVNKGLLVSPHYRLPGFVNYLIGFQKVS